MAAAEIMEEFGRPASTLTLQPSRCALEYFVGNDSTLYYLALTIDEKDGFVYLTMMNHPDVVDAFKSKHNATEIEAKKWLANF